jgi:LPXTG-site transpeptidase (sortase) family protein
MINASSLRINIISLIITLLIFNAFEFAKENINFEIPSKNIVIENSNITNKEEPKEEKNIEETEIEKQEKTEEIPYEWGISIPTINLKAQISEGTTKEVMDKYVGHFVDTGVIKGNICLGAHNRGYPVNYFENIKSLNKNNLIFYKKEDKTYCFKVETVTVIRDTDWTYLEETEDNRITLITCVENEPDYRRCVQAVEVKGGI